MDQPKVLIKFQILSDILPSDIAMHCGAEIAFHGRVKFLLSTARL
jgi:hypothetical protein